MKSIHGWLALSPLEQRQYLQALSDATGRTPFMLEKDIWVVDVLRALFESEIGQHLAFKGGTSLSKGFQLIDRFSEDIDVAWDMSTLIEIPPRYKSGNFMDSYGVKADARLVEILTNLLVPLLRDQYLECDIDFIGKEIFLQYPSAIEDAGLKQARVKIEFDARSAAAPTENRMIAPYAVELPGFILWDEFHVRCYPPEFTFWEKICAIYRYTMLNNLEWELARHWCDVVDIWDRIGENRILNQHVALEVITNSAVRKLGNVDSRKLLETGIILNYDQASQSSELIDSIHETNRQGYFLEPRDVTETLSKLEKLEVRLNSFIQASASNLPST